MSKKKRIYMITANGYRMGTMPYTCLKTLCEQWKLERHYGTIWKNLKANGFYDDGTNFIICKDLIKSEYNRKQKENE